MTEAAGRHIAVEKIGVAYQTGVEERGLIGGSLAAANESAATRRSIFLELFAQRLEGRPWQRGDCTAEAVQNVALV